MAAGFQEEALIFWRYQLLPGGSLRVLVLFGLLLIAIQTVACVSRTPVRYDRGTWRFNWGSQKEVSQVRKQRLGDQYNRAIQLLQVKLQDSVVLEAVRSANVSDRDITLAQIEELDRKWRKPGEEIAKQLTDKECNESLKLFQNTYGAFAEIFVTSVRGLNVCQTNKTTDYYQADEDWWQRTFTSGMSARQSSLEFDESSGVFAVPIYLPIRYPTRREVIGVAKAIILEKPSLR
jgi:hypothetical protein